MKGGSSFGRNGSKRGFSPKNCPKNSFLEGHKYWLTDFEAGPAILNHLPFLTYSLNNVGHKVSHEPLHWEARWRMSILSDRQPLESFPEGHKKMQNWPFFPFGLITWNFDDATCIQSTTMWNLTSGWSRQCGTFWVLNFFNRSYCFSKWENSEILAPPQK